MEFGDFQTPLILAQKIISKIVNLDDYEKIIEPTCGIGTFIIACLTQNINKSKIEGWEINPNHVTSANQIISNTVNEKVEIVKEQDFFEIDWVNFKKENSNKILFLGNPPWITNSELSKLFSNNLPDKCNFQKFKGIEALTGKSNFDISEWMIIQLLEYISGSSSAIAFLIKTSVARKLFKYINDNQLLVSSISINLIDAKNISM